MHKLSAPRAGVLLLFAAALLAACEARCQDKQECHPVFYRVLSAQTNAPILPKTRSALSKDGGPMTGNTGMADEGFTEYPCATGTLDLTFVEGFAIYPRFISGLQADRSRVNTADMVVDHVYAPDGVVWGLPGREFVQTFTATGDELVSITLVVASDPGTFRVQLLGGGPGGARIGSARSFSSGHSMEHGHARWQPGEAPLVPGRTYGLRIWREDGAVFSPYLHSTGNASDTGVLFVDGLLRAESDLAVWIVEQPDDLRRALVEKADGSGWVHAAAGAGFRPRSANIRLISATAGPVSGHCNYLVLRVRDESGAIIAGPKFGIGCGPDGGFRSVPFIFAAEEFPVKPGRLYTAEIGVTALIEGHQPDLSGVEYAPRDIRLAAYGEPEPGALPSMGNLRADLTSDSEILFSWSVSPPAPVSISIDGPGVRGGDVVQVPAGQTSVRVGQLWSGHEYDFRISAAGPAGKLWRLPVYRMRMPRNDVEPIVQPQYPKDFITLAPPRLASAPDYGPVRYRQEAGLANGDFEEDLSRWQAEGGDRLYATADEHGIAPRNGKKMVGWSILSGDKREQVFAESMLFQKVKTTPGHRYAFSAWAFTAAPGGPRGDTRVRLFADPAGGVAFGGSNTSQWYWTDGRWMRFQHTFLAQGQEAVIGCGFFRWRDLQRASAYVDRVCLYDLGPAGSPADCASAAGAPPYAIGDVRPEAEERVEAFAQAPPGFVITGLGARGHEDNVTTIWLKVRPVLADGTLGAPEEIRGGWEPDAGLEAVIELPDGYVLTGFGARAAPEWDVKSMTVWGRPLNRDGSLGAEKEFHGGIEPDRGPERMVKAPDGRVLVSAGMNMSFNDINAVRADSAALVRRLAPGHRPD